MNYEEAINYLESLGRFGIKPGLGRVSTALNLTGNPERNLRFIHITGTNGKGSTTAMVTAILRSAGLRTARFTSPHLSDYCERIVVDEQPISHQDFSALITDLQPVIDRVSAGPDGSMTEFEVLTLAALCYFASRQPDVCVMEVGMGGRLDSTNVILPVVSVITPVDMDHMDRLGSTLTEIAAEKAGIIKDGRPVVISRQKSVAENVIREHCRQKGAPLYALGQNFSVTNVTTVSARESTWPEKNGIPGTFGTFCTIKGVERSYENLHINLYGKYQADNAATAVASCEVFAARTGLRLDSTAVRRGLAEVVWPGRCEVFHIPHPLQAGVSTTLVIDGAHNMHGIRGLTAALTDLFPGYKVRFVIGILDNRPVEEMVAALAPLAVHFYATAAVYNGVASPDRIAKAVADQGVAISIVEGGLNALNQALSDVQPNEIVCLCGSLYLVGEVRTRMIAAMHGGDCRNVRR
ncbi:MAG: bifunctional folylpolyglutamate synthase/dihydrofolate synthase [Bacillota bacterium]|jgi:dihydrofolate synthase/folylpolyglutamate synthase